MNIEQLGFEDGYYNDVRRPPLGATEAYMRGYWAGCLCRRDEDRRLDILAAAWAEEDRAEAPGQPEGRP